MEVKQPLSLLLRALLLTMHRPVPRSLHLRLLPARRLQVLPLLLRKRLVLLPKILKLIPKVPVTRVHLALFRASLRLALRKFCDFVSQRERRIEADGPASRPPVNLATSPLSQNTITASSGSIVVVTALVTSEVSNSSPASSARAGGSLNGDPTATSSSSFFDNTGAVAGTFTVVSLVALALIIGLGYCFVRRKRQRRLEEDTRVAAGGAGDGGAGVNRFEGEDEDPFEAQDHSAFRGDRNSNGFMHEVGAAGGMGSVFNPLALGGGVGQNLPYGTNNDLGGRFSPSNNDGRGDGRFGRFSPPPFINTTTSSNYLSPGYQPQNRLQNGNSNSSSSPTSSHAEVPGYGPATLPSHGKRQSGGSELDGMYNDWPDMLTGGALVRPASAARGSPGGGSAESGNGDLGEHFVSGLQSSCSAMLIQVLGLNPRHSLPGSEVGVRDSIDSVYPDTAAPSPRHSRSMSLNYPNLNAPITESPFEDHFAAKVHSFMGLGELQGARESNGSLADRDYSDTRNRVLK